MADKDVTDIRELVEFLKREDELLVTNKQVDPIYEVNGVAKAFEDGPAVLFENIKGYPEHRILANVFGKRTRLTKIFNVSDPKDLKFKCLRSIKNPIAPSIVENAPCREVVITQDIDILKTIPVTQSIETDPGRIIGGGISLISGTEIGHCISYRRTFFRGKDWASMHLHPGSHVGKFLTEFRKRKEKLPLTLNIGCPPAVMTVAASGSLHQAIPAGSDELAIAGGLQGFPVEICKAKTVDTYAIANAEWVIEGYLDPLQLVWESEEAEKTSDWQQPFLIEWRGYQGLARRAPKFKVTAVTHRKNNPIFYATVASGLECFTTSGSFVEAVIYDTCNHILPGLVENVSVLDSMHGNAGVVIQVKKKRREDDEFIKTLIMAAFTASVVLQLIIVVDEDINIYSAEDIIWVLMTRVKPKEDIIAFGMDEGVMPEVSGKSAAASLARLGRLGKLGFDATVSFEGKPLWSRKQHPKVELEKWFTGEEIARVRAQQNEYARFISEYRF